MIGLDKKYHMYVTSNISELILNLTYYLYIIMYENLLPVINNVQDCILQMIVS